MYGGEDSSNNGDINNRETLQLSPHIAAHKSSICTTQGGNSSINESFLTQSPSKFSSLETYTSHIPVYRTGIPTSTIYKAGIDPSESIQSNIKCGVNQVNRLLPQDLSSNASKPVSINGSEHKSLPHIHTVVSSGADGYAAPVFVSERPQTYYRLADGTTIAIAGQHQAVLLSTLGNEAINSNGIQHGSSMLTQENHNSLAHQTSVGGVTNSPHSLPINNEIVSVSQENNIIIPDVLPSGILANSDLLTIKEHLESKKIKEEDDEGDQKDLVKQALQAAVVHNTHRGASDQEVIEYSYSAGDIAGPGDCLVHEDMICHSTFCPQTNFKPQELLMMNIHVSNGGQNINKVNGMGMGPNLNETNQAGQVVYVQSSAGVLEDTNGSAFVISPNRRRRTKLTEAAQTARRDRIASRMRDKRANESDDQKLKRRIREAERMRRKRAMEDDNSKSKRRREAADRARMRRAKLSPDEKDLERQKAARRMRLRRQNENEDQKRVRRLKAAERMRKRRATETPEQRVARKQSIALRMKAKRRKKDDDSLKMEGSPLSMSNVMLCDSDGMQDEALNHPEIIREGVIVSEPNAQFLSQGHIVTLPGNLALHQNDGASSHSPSTGPHLFPMDLASIPIPTTTNFRARNSASILPEKVEDIDSQPIPLHKLAVITQGPSASSLPDGVQSHSRSTVSSSSLQPVSLHKAISTSLVNSHHLPHILNHHHLSPQSHDSHQQSRIHENHTHLSQPIPHHQPQTSSQLRQ